MTVICQVVQADGSTLVVDLNGSSSTAIKLVWFDPGDPVRIEAWSGGWDAPGGTLKKSQDRPRVAHLSIAIPAQASDAALETLVTSVRDAFYTTGNLLKHQVGSGATLLYPLYRSRLRSPKASEEVARMMAVQKMVPRWDFDFTMGYAAQGQSVYAI